MPKKDLDSIVSESSQSSGTSTKKYFCQKLFGHAVGALSSIGGAYVLENILGYGKAITSVAEEVIDKGVDEAGFHGIRGISERKNPRYKGLAGFGKYVSDSIGYTARHIPGILISIGAGALATYGLSTIFQLPVYIASIVPRAVEITTEILSSLFFTKGYRQRLSELQKLPLAYATT